MTTEFTKADKRKAAGYEFLDMLASAAFPFMLQIIFSASIILFADNGDIALRIVAIVAGEALLIGAYLIFGRQNGIAGYRKTVTNVTKRANSDDVRSHFKVGEYALWKGFVVGLITCTPYIIFQFVQCVVPNSVCEFIVKYAFGWAWYPLSLAGVPEFVNFVWVIPLTCVHAGAYYWGASLEMKRQKQVADAQSEVKKGKK